MSRPKIGDDMMMEMTVTDQCVKIHNLSLVPLLPWPCDNRLGRQTQQYGAVQISFLI